MHADPGAKLSKGAAAAPAHARRAEPPMDAAERLIGLFHRSPIGIFQTTPDGHYLAANQALARMYGYSSPAELMAAVSDIHRQLYVQPGRRAAFLRQMAKHGRVVQFESQIYCGDGSVRWISEDAVAVCDAQSRLLYYEGFVTDTTARYEAGEALKGAYANLERTLAELRETQQQIVRTERLRALGEMVCGVGHDFNNALSIMLGYGELLLQKTRNLPQPELAGYAEIIVNAAANAGNLVNRLSDFHRPADAAEAVAVVSLNVALEQAQEFTRPRWEAQMCERGTPITFELELAKTPAIAGNAAELRQLATNLIFNAVDAMPQGGRLHFRTRAAGEMVELSVTDSGMGMTEETLRRCFEPFFTTKGEERSGLGLATVYGIVERHKGTVSVESVPGRGTKFALSFPAIPAAEVPSCESAAASRPLRILVVDDQPALCELLAHGLERDAHKVTMAGNGREALDLFERQEFDLVITDKAMAQMNGDQLAAAIKAREPEVKVIMLTGFGNAADSREHVSEFIDLLLAKPVSFAGLRQAIAELYVGESYAR